MSQPQQVKELQLEFMPAIYSSAPERSDVVFLPCGEVGLRLEQQGGRDLRQAAAVARMDCRNAGLHSAPNLGPDSAPACARGEARDSASMSSCAHWHNWCHTPTGARQRAGTRDSPEPYSWVLAWTWNRGRGACGRPSNLTTVCTAVDRVAVVFVCGIRSGCGSQISQHPRRVLV